MPKYLLLKHYRGGPEPHRPVPPMDQWAPADVEAHMAFLKHVSELLEENGEYVDAYSAMSGLRVLQLTCAAGAGAEAADAGPRSSGAGAGTPAPPWSRRNGG